MKKLLLVFLVFSIALTSAFSAKAGLYRAEVEDESFGYYAYSASYNRNALLSIKNKESVVEVRVLGSRETTPDRDILISLDAAKDLGLLDSGYEEVEVTVLEEGESSSLDQGWIKIKAGSYSSNKDAKKMYESIARSGLNSYASIEDGYATVYARFIPQYMESEAREILASLGSTNPITLAEENPYT